MKLLVISADGNEAIFPGIKSILDQINVPYDTLIATQQPLTADMLSSGDGVGRYQGILLTTGNLAYYDSTSKSYQSALTAAQWQMLYRYQADFRVRQVTLYTYPQGAPDNYGMQSPYGQDTTTSPIQAKLTDKGREVFTYLNPATPVTIRNAWTYLAMPATTASTFQPLLVTDNGNPIVSVNNYSDGRQNLAITADGNADAIHTLSLGYGIVNWVTKGLFLGERKVYMTAQPDDMMIGNDIWDINAKRDDTGLEYRINGSDYNELVRWQQRVNTRHPDIRLEMPFNGVGSTGIYGSDTLTSAIKNKPNAFNWISHTYTHALLTSISYSGALDELTRNQKVAERLSLRGNSRDSMIQPEISGLGNPEFLRAAKDFGVRYILSDTSQPGWKNTRPNTGFYSQYQPSILIIPRYPTNLYYNVSKPDEWVSEYNYFYAPGGLFPTWDRPLTYSEILDKEADMWLRYLLKYDINPVMFHQSNLRAYVRSTTTTNGRSLLSDLIDRTLAKYNALFTLPIKSPRQQIIGRSMASRMTLNNAGVKARLNLDPNGANTISLSAAKPATVPITGIAVAGYSESYGGQNVSTVPVSNSLTISAPAWPMQ